MIKKLILGAIGAGIVVIGYFGFYLQSNNGVGVDLPEAPALFETSLSAPISSTATTIPLSSIIVRGGEQLANYNCFTIDEGSAQAEFVCGTISTSTTSLINASRGVSAKDGFTENSALQFAHRRGASVKVTDFPIIQLLRSQNNGDEAFENVLKYASGVVPAGANELADVGYVLSVVTGGAVSFDGLTVGATAGETVSAGQVVYFKTSDQQWYKVDADTSATYTGVLIGMAQGAGVDEGAISGGVLLNGVDANLTGLTAGNQYYISSTAGEATTTVGAISLGLAKSTTELIFNTTFGNFVSLIGDNVFSGDNTFNGETTLSGTTTISGEALETGLIRMTAGATINGATLPVPVYASSTDSEVYAMDGNTLNQQLFIGFAVSNSTNGNPILVQTEGIVDGFTGLTENKTYYVQDTAGTIASTTGTYNMKVGIAVSPTEILIQKGIRRASGATDISAVTTSGSEVITIGFRPSKIRIFGATNTNLNNNSHTVMDATWDNGVISAASLAGNSSGGVSTAARLYDGGISNYLTFSITSVTDTGFTISYTETGNFGVDFAIYKWEAEGEM